MHISVGGSRKSQSATLFHVYTHNIWRLNLLHADDLSALGIFTSIASVAADLIYSHAVSSFPAYDIEMIIQRRIAAYASSKQNASKAK